MLYWDRFIDWTDEQLEEEGLVRLKNYVECKNCGQVTNVARKEDVSYGVCSELCNDGIKKPKPLERYKHFKGNNYQILGYVNVLRYDKFHDWELEPRVKAMDCSNGDVMRTVEVDKNGSYVCRIYDKDWDRDRVECYILYQALYGEFGLFLREIKEFMGKVDKNKYPEVEQKYKYVKLLEE